MSKRPALIDTYAQFSLDVVEACGSRLRTRDGREYWDFYGGHAVALLGHCHPAVTRAVAEQAARLTFYSNVLPLEIRTRAAERLCGFAEAGLEQVFFCNSGSEANENALKVAIQQTGRSRIARLHGGWHGRTLLALSATTEEKLRHPFESILCDSVRIRPNDPAGLSSIDERVAAVIVEPIQSIAGVVEIFGDYLAALQERCRSMGAMLIYDEVQTGMGRLGRPYVAGEFGVCPDMVTTAKGLANGIPIGALLMNARVAAEIKQGDLGSTFGGGPVACAAMLAVLDTIQRENLLRHAVLLGEQIREKLCVGPVTQILGRGCLLGLRTTISAKALQQRLMERGFVTGTSADSTVLRLMPPINTPIDAVDELADAIIQVGEKTHAALA